METTEAGPGITGHTREPEVANDSPSVSHVQSVLTPNIHLWAFTPSQQISPPLDNIDYIDAPVQPMSSTSTTPRALAHAQMPLYLRLAMSKDTC